MERTCYLCDEQFEWEPGMPQRCPDCVARAEEEAKEERRRNLPEHLARANVPAQYRHCTREAWRGRWPVPSLQGESTTLIYGPVGRGKTHLATALLAGHVLVHGTGLWVGSAWYVEGLRRTFNAPPGASSTRLMDAVLGAPFLVLDDFPPDHLTEFVLGSLTNLLRIRYDHERHTVLTTNLGPVCADNCTSSSCCLQRVSARVASRFCSGRVVRLEGPDRRLVPFE